HSTHVAFAMYVVVVGTGWSASTAAELISARSVDCDGGAKRTSRYWRSAAQAPHFALGPFSGRLASRTDSTPHLGHFTATWPASARCAFSASALAAWDFL